MKPRPYPFISPIVWTALITPLTQVRQLDIESLVSLLKEQEKYKNGIILFGSTGEGLNLSLEEKKQILETVFSLNLKVPILAGLSGHDFVSLKSWVELLETYPLQGYLAVTPYYSKPGRWGQYEWFSSLFNITKRPIMLYNVPGRTGASLSLEAVKDLKKFCPHLWAIKESSGNPEYFSSFLNDLNDKSVSFFCGDDALIDKFSLLGAVGLISVASNVWPEYTQHYVKKCLDKTVRSEEITLWKEACDSLFLASNPIPVKCLLKSLGKIQSPKLKLPLDHRDLGDHLCTLLSFHEKISKKLSL